MKEIIFSKEFENLESLNDRLIEMIEAGKGPSNKAFNEFAKVVREFVVAATERYDRLIEGGSVAEYAKAEASARRRLLNAYKKLGVKM